MIAFSLKTSVKSYQNPAKPGLKIYFSYSTIRKPDTISTYLISPATYAILGDWTHEPLSVPLEPVLKELYTSNFLVDEGTN